MVSVSSKFYTCRGLWIWRASRHNAKWWEWQISLEDIWSRMSAKRPAATVSWGTKFWNVRYCISRYTGFENANRSPSLSSSNLTFYCAAEETQSLQNVTMLMLGDSVDHAIATDLHHVALADGYSESRLWLSELLREVLLLPKLEVVCSHIYSAIYLKCHRISNSLTFLAEMLGSLS